MPHILTLSYKHPKSHQHHDLAAQANTYDVMYKRKVVR